MKSVYTMHAGKNTRLKVMLLRQFVVVVTKFLNHRHPEDQEALRAPLSCRKFCFLCGEEITQEFIKLQQKLPVSRRNVVHTVESLGVRATLLEAAERRGDEWAHQIIHRLSSVTDLVAADGRYHSKCRMKLYQALPTTGLKRGYIEPKNLTESMDCIYAFIEDNREECQFLLSDLMKKIKGDFKPDIRTIKEERLRVVKAAAEIVVQDIRAKTGNIKI